MFQPTYKLVTDTIRSSLPVGNAYSFFIDVLTEKNSREINSCLTYMCHRFVRHVFNKGIVISIIVPFRMFIVRSKKKKEKNGEHTPKLKVTREMMNKLLCECICLLSPLWHVCICT